MWKQIPDYVYKEQYNCRGSLSNCVHFGTLNGAIEACNRNSTCDCVDDCVGGSCDGKYPDAERYSSVFVGWGNSYRTCSKSDPEPTSGSKAWVHYNRHYLGYKN